MITHQSPNPAKAEALKNMALITLERLEATDKLAYPSLTLLDYYEAIHKLLEALLAQEGIKVYGEGAHQELIDFTTKRYELSEAQRVFLHELRTYRNKISYEGFSVTQEYVERNETRLKGIAVLLLDRL